MPRAAAPVRRRSRPAAPTRDFISDWNDAPFNPLNADLTPYEGASLDDGRLREPASQIGLYILALLIGKQPGHDKRHMKRGLQDLYELRGRERLIDLTRARVQEDEEDIRDAGRVEAFERLQRAQARPEGPARDRAVAAAERNMASNGRYRWSCYLAAISAVRRLAYTVGVIHLPEHPASRLRGPENRDTTREMLTEEQMTAVWRAAASFRDQELAILVLNALRETGTRRQALMDLMLDDIDWQGSTVLLHTKYQRTQRLPVSQELMESIALRAIAQGWDGEVLARRDPEAKARYAFRRVDGSPITRRWFDGLFDHIDDHLPEEMRDGSEKITAHWLRHTTIAQVERIAGPMVAGQWANHRARAAHPEGMEATAHYVPWNQTEQRALFTAMFPKTPPGPVDPVLLANTYQAMLDASR